MKKEKLFWLANVVFMISVFLTFNSFGATYYVKNGGNDTYTGLSDAQAWATISKVNSSVSNTSDCVYFKCGDTWTITSKLVIDWSGTSGAYAVVGAYYMDGGSEVHGVSGNKPVFDGNDTYPTGTWDVARWGCLVQCFENNYVTVENIRAINSEGRAFNFAYGTSLRALNLETENTLMSGIQFYKINTGLIERCTIREASRVAIEYPGNDWPATLSVNNYSNNITIKECTLYENHGEGIGLYKGSNNNIVEDNILYDNRSGQLYLEHTHDNIIRRNMIYNTTNMEYRKPRAGYDAPTDGIAICDELGQSQYPLNEGNKIYNNLIGHCQDGIYLAAGAPTGACVKDTEVYNNTVVDCNHSFYFTGPYENSYVRNNISYCITMDGDMPSYDYTGNTSTPGLTWSHNCWHSTPPGDLSGTGDVIGAPSLAKTTGWRSLTADSLKASDFALQAGSQCINAGIDVGLPYIGSAPDIGAYEYSLQGDFDGNGCVDIADLAMFVEFWLQCNDPQNPNCEFPF